MGNLVLVLFMNHLIITILISIKKLFEKKRETIALEKIVIILEKLHEFYEENPREIHNLDEIKRKIVEKVLVDLKKS